VTRCNTVLTKRHAVADKITWNSVHVNKAGNHIDLCDLFTFVLWRPKYIKSKRGFKKVHNLHGTIGISSFFNRFTIENFSQIPYLYFYNNYFKI
jgi:hypothetical protein